MCLDSLIKEFFGEEVILKINMKPKPGKKLACGTIHKYTSNNIILVNPQLIKISKVGSVYFERIPVRQLIVSMDIIDEIGQKDGWTSMFEATYVFKKNQV